MCFWGESCQTVDDAVNVLGLPRDSFYVLVNSQLASGSQQLQHGQVYRVVPRVLGGKGGFGSMLRAIGAQIEKTTSREACRDLSGRRVRDVNNEKKLKEWVSKQADREREKEERRRLRREKRERLLQEPQPKLEDPVYHEQYAKAQENLQAALQAGLQKVKEKERKRKGDNPDGGPAAKRLDWLGTGINPEDLDSDSDSGNSSSEASANAGPSASDMPHTSKASATVTSSALEGSDDDFNSCSNSSFGFAMVKQEHMDEQTDDSGANSNTDSTEQKVKQENGKTASSTSDSDTPSANKPTQESTGTIQAKSSSGADPAQKCAVVSDGDSSSRGQPEQKHTLLSSMPPPTSSSNRKESQSNGEYKPVDLDQYPRAEELEPLGLEHLKVELTRRGLKCGGTLEERAQRLFSIKGLASDGINPKLLAKPAKGKGKNKR